MPAVMKEILSEFGLQGVSHRLFSALHLCFCFSALCSCMCVCVCERASVRVWFQSCVTLYLSLNSQVEHLSLILLLTVNSFTPTKVPNIRYELSQSPPFSQSSATVMSTQVKHIHFHNAQITL